MRRSIRRHQLPAANFGLSDYYQLVKQVKFFPLDYGAFAQFNFWFARILDAWVEMLASTGLRQAASPARRHLIGADSAEFASRHALDPTND